MHKYLPVWIQPNNTDIKFEYTAVSSLAPKVLTKKEDIEKVKPYLDKLKDTLNAKDINNIALTGGYGSGKSSLIKTFQHWNKDDFNFLNISLAAFNQSKTKENFKELYDLKIKNGKSEKEAEKEIANEFKETLISNEELEKQLEISILQQIIYKVKPANLPESRFKRIVNIPKWKLFFLIPFCFVLWLSSIILLFKFNYLNDINPSTWILKNGIKWDTIFVFLFAFSGIGYFSKIVVELFSNSKINKVNLKGEIEIGDNSNKSILNEHYDEILYYFEKNDFNVVVIEDLDRFDNTNIFTKLRELNILLNNADSIRNKPAYKEFGIKFLYAVGDDLFNDKKERVKFFEYIIPVIPFINSTNAKEQLKSLFKQSGLEENIFPKEFLSDITTFIDDIDMRLLINIFHEFVIYRNILNPDALTGREAELFAMITYKNIDPEDFNKLNCKEGKLYKLIAQKTTYIKEFTDKIDKKIAEFNTEILSIKKENISEIEELNRLYLLQIFTKFPATRAITMSEIEINDLLKEKNFLKLIEEKSLSYTWRHQYGSLENAVLNFDFTKIENEVTSTISYKGRAKLIENKNNNQIEVIQKEIEKLKNDKFEIENWEIKQIFQQVDINQYLDAFSNNDLLRNLILEGYINENYNDYISLFHEVSLTKEDKKFERNVKSGKSEGFDYELKNIENLVDEHIELKYFGRETILNFDLLDFLANKHPIYSQQYDAIIGLLSNGKDRSIEFIDAYIYNKKSVTKESFIEIFGRQILSDDDIEKTNNTNEKFLSLFIRKLCKEWNGLWEYVYSKSNYTIEKEDNYLSLIIRYGEIEDILRQNKNVLITAINEKPHFLSIVKSTNELNYYGKITKLIEELDIKFEKLKNPNGDTKELFDFVYNNNHYQINKENLQQMIRLNGNIETIGAFETSNYTTILQCDCNPLIEYIESNINTYIEDVYLMLEQNKSDDEEILIKLLNNEDLEDNLKIRIIEKVEAKVSDLSRIDYIDIKKELLLNDKVEPNWKNVIDYYTDCENNVDENLTEFLNFENVYTELSKQKLSKDDEAFEQKLLLCNDILDEAYQELLSCSYFGYDSLSFENLDEDKVVGLIDKVLNTTKANYDLLREHFPNNQIKLIESDFDEFINNIDDYETDEEDILLILKSDNIINDNKFNYIPKLDEKIISGNKEIAKKVGDIILSKNATIELEFNTLSSIITNTNLTSNKVKLVNLYFESLTNENISSLIISIGWSYSELFVKKHKPTFTDTDYNRLLFEKLKRKTLIMKYETNKKDSSELRAYANY